MKAKLIIKNTLLSALVFVIISSCVPNIKRQKPVDIFEITCSESILQQKIYKRTEIQIGLDTSGNSLWSRIASIDIFNNKGLRTMSIIPGYLTNSWPNSSPNGLTLDEIEFYSSNVFETNIPNGKVDTTFFHYDDKGNLILIKNNSQTSFKYDKYNNLIERCVSSKFNEEICNYFEYQYDEHGNIVSSIDSAGVRASIGGRKFKHSSERIIYKYDNSGRILFDGNYERSFNEKGQLVKAKKFSADNLGNEYSFLYNKDGKRTCEICTKVISSTWNPKNNQISNIKTITTKKYYYYNEQGLLKQEKILDENDRLTSLTNFEYSYY